MVANQSIILRASERFSHADACRLACMASTSGAQTIILDMSEVLDATTAAFARLVLLRRELLQRGRDLRLAALRGQPAKLLEVHRLDGILPRLNELPTQFCGSPSSHSSTDDGEKPARRLYAEIASSYSLAG